MGATTTEHFTVAVIGAGPSGICTGVELQRKLGLTSFVIYEKSGEAGGTWFDNRYPGCACDIPSHLYSLSNEPNHDWTRAYSPSQEILRYYQSVARKWDLLSHTRFHHTLTSAIWSETHAHWELTLQKFDLATKTSVTVQSTANILISGMGALNRPVYPSIPGLENYKGIKMHTAEWDNSIDLTGKRVAVVGTAASAVQAIPALQPKVDKMVVFQRTPSWIVPRGDYKYPAIVKWIFRNLPGLRWVYRCWLYILHELGYPAFRLKSVRSIAQRLFTYLMRRQLPTGTLQKQLIPTYAFGCKRVLRSDDYLPAMAQPNVSLVTSGISHLDETSITDNDGITHEVDAVVFATGFQIKDVYSHVEIIGKGGKRLLDQWDMGEKPKVYLGMASHGFPNLWFLMGPYTGLGHNSIIFMIECQVGYITRALTHQITHSISYLEPTAEAESKWVAKVLKDIKSTTWVNGGCKSWYQNDSGEVICLWPGSCTGYWYELKRIHLDDWVQGQKKGIDKRELEEAQVVPVATAE
ncbi:4-hydroxyacetophenone monooxygenase [Gaertneriomyces semiglobifer]|nr:4-hydroxyacetophenone monooxygenase [Gaertneriomyces semiglobifer]